MCQALRARRGATSRVGRYIAAAVLSLGLSSAAFGSMITYQTPANSSTGGQSVDAQAIFTLSTNQVQITLTNLEANPRSVTQCISGIEFSLMNLSGNKGVSGSLQSSVGTERTINSTTKAFTDGSSAASGWKLSISNSLLDLTVLNTPEAPKHTIIGPPDSKGLYSNANPSITGGPHNLFLGLTATFTLSVPGVTSNSSICSATFEFNTDTGYDICGHTVNNSPPLPEPATIGLLGLAVPMLSMRRRRV